MPELDKDFIRLHVSISYKYGDKILNKTPADLIHQHMKRITYHDQVGIEGIEVWFNILKSINVTYRISGIKSKNIIISVDTVKAFDNNSTLCHESKQMKL